MRSLIPSRAAPAARRDPAPSRMAYKLQRLWLTPLFRVAVRLGLPLALVAVSVGAWLQDDARRAQVTGVFAELREKVKNRPEFAVTLLSVEGTSPEVAEAVRSALALPLPASSLDLDLSAARERVAALDAVREVELRVQSGGVLRVVVTEREPAVVWRTEAGLTLLDEEGQRVTEIWSRADRVDLPLLAGTGAEKAVPEALALIAAAGPLLPRVRGLVRIGERRWDVVLDRDQRILLPADQPLRAMERLIALDAAQGLLARDVLAVDLRLEGRPVLRLAPFALTEMRRARGIIPPETDL
jgi:cell division protein FtsQ